MATLIKKMKKGKPYWYAVESQRVNGKPRIVWQKYLGQVENIIKAYESPSHSKPKEVEVREFGAIAALLSVANDLGVVELMDQVVAKRRQGASIGQYLLLAALNRALAPTSKFQIGEWYRKTILRRLWKLPDAVFTSQRFWDAMGCVSEKHIQEIERHLVERLLKKEVLDLKTLLYDTTNFLTFISSSNKRNSIAQRGHSKRRRTDLRIVGLALLVSKEFGIPLFHETYAGNVNDSTEFKSVILSLIERCQQMSKGAQEMTLVFDKGNNGQEILGILNAHNIHFISSLRQGQGSDLLEIPESRYETLKTQNLAGVRAYRCRKTLSDGIERTVIVTLSDSRFSKEVSALTEDLAGAVRRLAAEAKQLEKWRRPSKYKIPTSAALKKRVTKILKKYRMAAIPNARPPVDSIVDIKIEEGSDGIPTLQYGVNHQALNERIRKFCGKTILFTDLENWTSEAIVTAYRNQAVVEDVFRNMNDWNFLRWRPMYHWTDQKIRVHAFYCVLAILLASLARKRATEAGPGLSMHEFLEKLSDMKEVILLYPPTKPPAPPRLTTVYSKQDPVQKDLSFALNLDAWKV